jgi:primosomal protein N' (replication factor Y)
MEEKRQLFVKPLRSKSELADLCRERPGPQAQVLEMVLQHPKGILLSELLEKAQVSRSPVASLAKSGILSLEQLEIDRSLIADQEFFQTKHKVLNPEQAAALKKIAASTGFETHLLHGVTGSGKTEVYLQAIDIFLARGKSALFLVPEIALTSQTVERLKARFEQRIAILHHRLSDGERRDAWHQIRAGKITLVVGARSALFSPLVNLGLIIVDEEHEPSYKQTDEMPCYHARDAAVMRGKICQAAVVLGSATPSLESYTNALSGKYTLSYLKERPANALLPHVTVVDMRPEFDKAKGFTLFSERLLSELEKRIKAGEQSILFLNRRGYHTAQSCQMCGHIVECPHCALSLTFHKGDNNLSCHLCNFELKPPPRSCPKCHAEALKFKGAGTEQVERALHAIFPEVRTLRLDGDTTRHKGSHEKFFKQFRSGKADVLIGTQMIAKGLHFPAVTLVGVLNADASLQIPDFRASEHVFQLLTQVAGRSGRGALPGLVLIQTHLPNHSTIVRAAAQDYENFYCEEIEVRKTFHYPPFSHLAKLTFSGLSSLETFHYAQEVRSFFIRHLPPLFEILPVVPCGYAKVKDRFRFQFLIKGENLRPITEILEKAPKKPSEVRMGIDIDPLATYL